MCSAENLQRKICLVEKLCFHEDMQFKSQIHNINLFQTPVRTDKLFATSMIFLMHCVKSVSAKRQSVASDQPGWSCQQEASTAVKSDEQSSC